MEELVQQVMQKTGISEQQAQGAVNTVVDYLKARLPGPVASQLDAALAGGASTGPAQGMLGGLGGMLDKQ
ncbi:MAG: hypothetical protein M1319_04915 [Chloroflexi bacterium]|nr:hypothetical protein [Chloroflexota bacterium]